MKRLLSFLLLFTLLGGAWVHAADYAVIANPDVPAAALSRDDAKSILLGTKFKWDNGANIKLAILAGGATHEKAISELTARSADQFEKYWKKQVFTGKGVMPDVLADDAAMIAFVAKTAGSVGYVSADAKLAGVKVLAVQ